VTVAVEVWVAVWVAVDVEVGEGIGDGEVVGVGILVMVAVIVAVVVGLGEVKRFRPPLQLVMMNSIGNNFEIGANFLKRNLICI